MMVLVFGDCEIVEEEMRSSDLFAGSDEAPIGVTLVTWCVFEALGEALGEARRLLPALDYRVRDSFSHS